MKVKLLKKWNLLMDFLFIGNCTYNMTLKQKIMWFLSCTFDKKMRALARQAYEEFNEKQWRFHYLGYTIGIGVMAWRLSKDKCQMHMNRRNIWDVFAHKYRKYSKKWNSPEAKLKRIINGVNE